jgi:NitT/TauT family transport system substrate-binding protein
VGAAALATLALGAAACGDDLGQAETSSVNVAVFANLTHAPGLIGLEEGIFAEAVGPDVTINAQVFNAGPDVVTGLLAGDIDIAFIGPNPAINAFAQSDGEAVRVISGSTSGGAGLVVDPSITSVADLEGKTIATPQLGNTQDVALRHFLTEERFEVGKSGGDVNIAPQANADALTAFLAGQVDGAWVPEPFFTRFQVEGGGSVLVDEADLWPDGRFVTTHVVARSAFLEDNRDLVSALVEGVADAVDLATDDPDAAKAAANAFIERETGKALPAEVLDAAWENLTFTTDPLAATLARSKDHAVEVGLLDDVDLADLYDLGALNEVLAARDQPEVEGL